MNSSVGNQGIFGQIAPVVPLLPQVVSEVFDQNEVHIGFLDAITLQLLKQHGQLCPHDFCNIWGILMSEGYELRDELRRRGFIKRVDPVHHADHTGDDQFCLTEKGEEMLSRINEAMDSWFEQKKLESPLGVDAFQQSLIQLSDFLSE